MRKKSVEVKPVRNVLSRILLLALVCCCVFPAIAQQSSLRGVGISDHRQTYLFFPMNILYQISNQLDTNTAKPGFLYNQKLTEQALRKLLGEDPITCKLTLEPPTGKIISVTIDKSSGSAQNDAKAIKLLKDCEPYCKDETAGKEQTYFIKFPELSF